MSIIKHILVSTITLFIFMLSAHAADIERGVDRLSICEFIITMEQDGVEVDSFHVIQGGIPFDEWADVSKCKKLAEKNSNGSARKTTGTDSLQMPIALFW